MKFEKTSPQVIFYRYDHTSVYKKIFVDKNIKGRPRKDVVQLKKAYNSLLPIAEEKKKDLLRLCKQNIIPEEFHGWYSKLPSKKLKKNTVPEPYFCSDDDLDDVPIA